MSTRLGLFIVAIALAAAFGAALAAFTSSTDSGTSVTAAVLDEHPIQQEAPPVALPMDDDAPIVMGEGEDAVSVTIGGELEASSVQSYAYAGGSVVVYEETDKQTNTVAHAMPEGGLQLLSVIEGPQAPTSFSYAVGASRDISAAEAVDGSWSFADAETGGLLTWAAPAWAFDANGRPVPTWYEWDGESLTQVVDHQAGMYAYPIVADPCFWGWRCARKVAQYAAVGAIAGSIGGAAGGCAVGALSLPTAPATCAAGAIVGAVSVGIATSVGGAVTAVLID